MTFQQFLLLSCLPLCRELNLKKEIHRQLISSASKVVAVKCVKKSMQSPPTNNHNNALFNVYTQ